MRPLPPPDASPLRLPSWWLLAALVFSAASADAQRGGVPISGRVSSEDGVAVTEGRVELTPLAEGLFQEPTVTAQLVAGRFAIIAPHRGMWRLTVRAPGFVPAQATLEPLLGRTALPPAYLPKSEGAPVAITDEEGRPLPGVEVRATAADLSAWPHQGAGTRWLPAGRSGHTDGHGRLVLPRGSREELAISAASEGRSMVWTARAAAFEATLPPADPWRLRLLDAVGVPVGGARLRWLPGEWGIGPSDPDGHLESFAVQLDASGALPQGVLELGPGRRQRLRHPPDSAGVIRTEAPRLLTGTLISAADGAPVVGAWIWRRERAHLAVRSDEQGRFRLAVEPGASSASLRLRLAAAGFISRRAAYDDSAPEPIYALDPAAALAGRVVDADGRPNADVEIHAPSPSSRGGPTAFTDAEGRFYVGQLKPEKSLRLEFSREDLRNLDYEAAPLAPFEVRRGLRLVMDAAALVVGQVVDAEGFPLPGAKVEMEGSLVRSGEGQAAEIAGDDESLEVTCDAEGRFAASLTREGRLDLTIQHPGFATLRLESIAVQPSEDRFDLGSIALERSAIVEGRVVDPEDSPLAGIEIYVFSRAFERYGDLHRYLRWRRPDAVSAADGRFTIDGFHAGDSVDLVASGEGFARLAVPGITAPTESPLHLVLEPAAQLSGRVIDAAGEGVPRAEILVRRPVGLDPSADVNTRTDTQGAFELADLPHGLLDLWIRSSAHPTTRRQIELTGDRDDLTIELSGGFVVAGVVLDPDRLPVSGAALRLRPAPGSDGPPAQRRATTDAAGRFLLRGVGRGAWRLGVSRDWFEIERPLSVEGDLELELILDAPGEPLSGQVSDEQGQGVDGVRLQLTGEGGKGPGTVSKAGGLFHFPRVAAGRWRILTAFSPRQVDAPVALVRDPGAFEVDGDPSTPESSIDLVVGYGATLRGQVTGLPPQDLPRVTISASGETSFFDKSRIKVDARGQYLISRLAVGRWRVQAHIPGTGRRAAAEVTVLPGERDARLDLDFSGGLRLAGQVVADGEPLTHAAVGVTDGFGLETRVRTDLSGRFELTGLRPGPLQLRVRVHGSDVTLLHRLDLETDQQDLVFDLLD